VDSWCQVALPGHGCCWRWLIAAMCAVRQFNECIVLLVQVTGSYTDLLGIVVTAGCWQIVVVDIAFLTLLISFY